MCGTVMEKICIRKRHFDIIGGCSLCAATRAQSKPEWQSQCWRHTVFRVLWLTRTRTFMAGHLSLCRFGCWSAKIKLMRQNKSSKTQKKWRGAKRGGEQL